MPENSNFYQTLPLISTGFVTGADSQDLTKAFKYVILGRVMDFVCIFFSYVNSLCISNLKRIWAENTHFLKNHFILNPFKKFPGVDQPILFCTK